MSEKIAKLKYKKNGIVETIYPVTHIDAVVGLENLELDNYVTKAWVTSNTRSNTWVPTAGEISGMGTIGKKVSGPSTFDFDSFDIPSGIYAFNNIHPNNPPTGRYGTIIQTQYRVGEGARYGIQIAFHDDSDRMFTRRTGSAGNSPWVEIATQPWVTSNTRSSSWTPSWGQVSDKPYIPDISTDNVTKFNNLISGSYNLPYYTSIVVYGDSNKYYPVHIASGSQDLMRTIKIWRAYYEQGPNDWYSSTHKGSLNLEWRGNFGGWGGAVYNQIIIENTNAYTTLLAETRLGVDNSYAVAFFLRGGGSGGAIYHIASDQPLSWGGHPYLTYDKPTAFYNQDLTFNNPDHARYAPAPLTAVNESQLNSITLLNPNRLTKNNIEAKLTGNITSHSHTTYVDKIVNLSNSVDLNTVLTSGFYRLEASPVNGPSGVNCSYSQMIVSRGGDTISQMILPYQSNSIYIRNATTVTISTQGWTTIASEDWVQGQLDGKANLTGATFTGQIKLNYQGALAYNNVGLELRERELVLHNQSSEYYAPAIGFHWGNRHGNILLMDSSGILRYGSAGSSQPIILGDDSRLTNSRVASSVNLSSITTKDINTKDGDSLYVKYNNKEIKIRIESNSWASFYTNLDKWYFDKNVYIKGDVYTGTSYNKKLATEEYVATSMDKVLKEGSWNSSTKTLVLEVI